MEYKYPALKINQTPESKPIYVTSCSASNILEWCDVPRSKEGFMAGYQRDLDSRFEKISDFILEDPINNIIPNAIIIAVDEKNFRVNDNEITQPEIVISTAERNLEQLLSITLESFEKRLSVQEIESIDSKIKDEFSGNVEEDDITDDIPPESYLAELTANLRNAKQNFPDLTPTKKAEIEGFLKGLSKPGLILDGQHRVFGAKEIPDFDVKFPVIIIPGLPHMEQVFHFYVLNNKAKPLNKTHLRKIISTSLSKQEIANLYDRFKQAGVEAKQAEWTHKMNNDRDSPFRGLIDMGFEGENGAITENIAYQLVSKFMHLHRKYKLLVKDVNNWDLQENEYRLSAFFHLWSAVRSKYPDAWRSATEGEGQLFYKVSLIVLQELILDSMNQDMPRRIRKNEGSPLNDVIQIEEEVAVALDFLPETFFVTEWKAKSLDTQRGHQRLRTCMDKAIQNQGKFITNLDIFKEE